VLDLKDPNTEECRDTHFSGMKAVLCLMADNDANARIAGPYPSYQ
jgi:hypothetical protein